MQNAYLSIIDLKFEKGLDFIEKEKQQNPNNGLIHLHENYKDFLALIIGEDQQLFDKISSNKSKRLSAIREMDRTVGRLIDGLKSREIFQKVNIILVSDHGMATTSPKLSNSNSYQ